VDKDNREEQIDDDILESRADILRASGMTPSGEEQSHEQSKSEGGGEDATPPADTVEETSENQEPPNPETTQMQVEPAEPTEEAAEPASSQAEKSEIPRFDVAEKIMAGQRRITAVRRKGPGETKGPESPESGVEAASESFGQAAPAQPQKDENIADMVARDIERLLRGEPSDV
jgi:hypothetical protein